jgi:hypothetical protein
MATSRYYYDNCAHFNKDKYKTLWNGYLTYNIDDPYIKSESESELNDLIVEICERNFYITLEENYIYLSFDSDEYLYHYEFEKTLKPLIVAIQNKFKISNIEGEFFATEIKHCGNQYKYIIHECINEELMSESESQKKLKITKKTLNWDNYEKLKTDKSNKKIKIKK